jgi:hypothetical protein
MGLAHTSKVPAVVRDLRLGHLRVFNGVMGRVCLEAPILRPDRGPSSQHDPPDYAAGQAAPSRGECTVGFHIPSAPRGNIDANSTSGCNYAMPDIVFESQNMGRNLSTQPGIVLIISMDSGQTGVAEVPQDQKMRDALWRRPMSQPRLAQFHGPALARDARPEERAVLR